MSVLADLVSRVPFQGAYNQRVKENEAASMQSLQQAGGLMGLVTQAQKQQALMRDEQEGQQLREIVRQAGGDPRKAVQALISSGTPQGIVLAEKLSGLLKTQQGQPIGTGLLMPDGKIVAPPEKPQPSDVARLLTERDALPPEHPNRPVYDSALNKRTETPERFSNLQRLLREKSELPPGDPGHVTYANAIRKESETAKQISPTIHMPRPEQPPVAIPDATSPTGFRYGTRAEALNRPAPAPAGFAPKRDPLAKATYDAGLKDLQRDEKDLANVAQIENALNRWKELQPNVATGRVVGLRPAVGQPQMQELVQLQSYLAVNNFKPGQGQISNFERQLIKGAGPTVNNDPETNQRLVDIQLGAVQNAKDRAAFREQYLEKNQKLLGADKLWNEYIEKNPRYTKGKDGQITPNAARKEWTEWFGSMGAAAPAQVGSSVDALLEKYK